MPYATLDNVQQRMPQFTLSAVTKPNAATAQVFLDDTEAQFESAMANLGYTIPITGTRSLKQCIEIISQGTIAKILYARAAAVGTDVAVQSADRAQKQYDDILKALADARSPIELDDAPRGDDKLLKTSDIGPMGDFDFSETEDGGLSTEAPRFTMQQKF